MEKTPEQIENEINVNMQLSSKELRDRALAAGLRGQIRYRLSKKELAIYLATGEVPAEGAGNGGAVPEGGDLAAVIADAIKGHLELTRPAPAPASGIDEAAVMKLIEKYVSKAHRFEIITEPGGEPKDCGVQHFAFEKLCRIAKLKINTLIVGPAGSGKTHVCRAVAAAVGIDFYAHSVGPQTSKSDLIGYTSVAEGKYISTALYTAFKYGGMYLLDEVDAGNGGVLTIVNAAMENGFYRFPDGEEVKMHDDFLLWAAANTFGRGATRTYVGRQPLDGATLDRFTVFEMLYDEDLEKQLYGDTRWTRRVQRIRAKVEESGERMLISPRASRNGNKLLAAGFSEDEVMEMVIWKGVSKEIRERINVN